MLQQGGVAVTQMEAQDLQEQQRLQREGSLKAASYSCGLMASPISSLDHPAVPPPASRQADHSSNGT